MRFEIPALELLGVQGLVLVAGFVVIGVFAAVWPYLVIPLRWYYVYLQVVEGSRGRIATLRRVLRARPGHVDAAQSATDPEVRARIETVGRMRALHRFYFGVLWTWGVLTLILVAKILLGL